MEPASASFLLENVNLDLLRRKCAFQHGHKMTYENEYIDKSRKKFYDNFQLPDILPI